MYNPYQSYQLDNIDNQIKNLERQRAILTQSQQPIVNNYLNTQPLTQTQYDFNGKWVENEEEAKNVSNANLPLIIMNKNESKFYMKNVDGSFKSYSFEECKQEVKEDNTAKEIESIKLDLSKLTEAIETILANSNTQVSKKEMKKNESTI